MKTGLILYINNDLCELYIVEENRRDFAFITEDIENGIELGDLCVVYQAKLNMLFSKKEVNLC